MKENKKMVSPRLMKKLSDSVDRIKVISPF
jgi:hypothetical protein